MGLSQLHQLRGRVGRSHRSAFAYLLFTPGKALSEISQKRLDAIRKFTEFGSGFRIAMRDLEIRGAGNLLGAEQSGHITAVGFELYCQLLKQSVASLKGEKIPKRVEVEVRLDFLPLTADDGAHPEQGMPQAAASIPMQYVPEPQHRIEIYRKLAQAGDKAAVTALEKELRDRFGPLPQPVQWLLAVTELKTIAAGRGVTTIEVKEGKVMLTRNNDYVMAGSRFPRLTKKEVGAKLNEIRKLLLLLAPQHT
jgi:transcription-repair coupling factor (superfamily II helicase)